MDTVSIRSIDCLLVGCEGRAGVVCDRPEILKSPPLYWTSPVENDGSVSLCFCWSVLLFKHLQAGKQNRWLLTLFDSSLGYTKLGFTILHPHSHAWLISRQQLDISKTQLYFHNTLSAFMKPVMRNMT